GGSGVGQAGQRLEEPDVREVGGAEGEGGGVGRHEAHLRREPGAARERCAGLRLRAARGRADDLAPQTRREPARGAAEARAHVEDELVLAEDAACGEGAAVLCARTRVSIAAASRVTGASGIGAAYHRFGQEAALALSSRLACSQ